MVIPAASEARPSTAKPVATPGASELPKGVVTLFLLVLLKVRPSTTLLIITTPDATDTKYTAPIEFSAGVTIKAIAYVEGHAPSTVLSATYTVAPKEVKDEHDCIPFLQAS